MDWKNQTIAHLLLAAGASTRMGQPKQLLKWEGQSLIQASIYQIQLANIAKKVIVVLGAHQELILPKLEGLNIVIVYNPDWAEGMGSSIRSGMKHLLEDKSIDWDGVLISLVDQPLVQARHFQELYQLWQKNEKPIAAAQYQKTLGVPAIFDASIFPQLLALGGAEGARKILKNAKDRVVPLDLPEAQFDMDTPDDFQRLQDLD